jgi:hypothetical protein
MNFVLFVAIIKTSFGGDSFYLHRFVYRNMVRLRVRFGASLSGLKSPAVIMMLIVTRRRPSIIFII